MAHSDPPPFERWLSTPARRMVLVGMSAVVLSAIWTLLLMDYWSTVEAQRPDRDFGIDWVQVFLRRLITWGLWGLTFEPVLLASRWIADHLRPATLMVLAHGGLSIGLGYAVPRLDEYVGQRAFSNEELSSMRPSGRRGDREGRGPESRGSEGRGPEGRPGEGRTGEGRTGEGRPGEGRIGEGRTGERGDGRQAFFERSMDLRQQRERTQRMAYGIAFYWLVLGMALAVQSFLRRREEERRAAGLEAALTEARLAQLQAQLQPHFLFNALHSVGGLVRSGENQVAISTLSALGDLLRMTLEHGDDQRVSLGDELDLCECYLDVERIRLGDRLGLEMEMSEEVAAVTVPALLLLPLVENAIKYAIAPRSKGGVLRVVATSEAGELRIVIEDDGPGFPADVLAGSNEGGIGLRHTRRRMETLYGADSIQLENIPGARVTLRLPLEKEDRA